MKKTLWVPFRRTYPLLPCVRGLRITRFPAVRIPLLRTTNGGKAREAHRTRTSLQRSRKTCQPTAADTRAHLLYWTLWRFRGSVRDMSEEVSAAFPEEMSTAPATRDVRWLPLPYVLLDDQWFGRKWRRCRPSFGFGRDGAPPAPLRAGDPLLPETRKVLGGFKQMCRLSGGAVRCGFWSCHAQVRPSGHQGHGPADVMWGGARCRGGTPRSQGRRDRGGSTRVWRAPADVANGATGPLAAL